MPNSFKSPILDGLEWAENMRQQKARTQSLQTANQFDQLKLSQAPEDRAYELERRNWERSDFQNLEFNRKIENGLKAIEATIKELQLAQNPAEWNAVVQSTRSKYGDRSVLMEIDPNTPAEKYNAYKEGILLWGYDLAENLKHKNARELEGLRHQNDMELLGERKKIAEIQAEARMAGGGRGRMSELGILLNEMSQLPEDSPARDLYLSEIMHRWSRGTGGGREDDGYLRNPKDILDISTQMREEFRELSLIDAKNPALIGPDGNPLTEDQYVAQRLQPFMEEGQFSRVFGEQPAPKPVAPRFGAAFLGLTLDEDYEAMSPEERVNRTSISDKANEIVRQQWPESRIKAYFDGLGELKMMAEGKELARMLKERGYDDYYQPKEKTEKPRPAPVKLLGDKKKPGPFTRAAAQRGY